MAKYFSNVNNLQELRKQYKDLLKKHHPDNGGNVADMQKVNAEYDRLFKLMKDKHDDKMADSSSEKKAQADYNTNMYDWENDKSLREVLQKIISFSGIEIEIAGQWIWVSGNTYAYKKELKEIGFKWANTKKQWYFHTEVFQKRSRKTLSMDEIRSRYGSTTVQTMQRDLIEAQNTQPDRTGYRVESMEQASP